MQGVAVVKAIRCRLHSTLVVAGVENPLARICAQKEPVVSPAGTGTEYRSTRRVSWGLVLLSSEARHQGTRRNEKSADQSVREIRAADESAFSSNQRNSGDGHTLQKDGACWVPRGREVCASTVVDTMGEVVEPRPILRSVAACVSRCVLRWLAGWAGCLCNRDSCGRTRKDRSCRCVDGWRCHTAGRRGPRVT